MSGIPARAMPEPRVLVKTIAGVATAPWGWMKRSVAAVVVYPVRNLGKHMPMG